MGFGDGLKFQFRRWFGLDRHTVCRFRVGWGKVGTSWFPHQCEGSDLEGSGGCRKVPDRDFWRVPKGLVGFSTFPVPQNLLQG